MPTDLLIAQKFGLEKSVHRVKKLGFDFVEVFLEPPFDGEWKAEDIKILIENTRLKVLGHFTWYADLSSWYSEVRKAWVKVCKNALNFFNKVGAKYVTFHTNAFIKYPYLKPMKNKFLSNLIDSFRTLEKHAENIGMGILVENAAENYEITKLSDITKLMDELEVAKINLDIGHAFVNNTQEEVFEFIKSNKTRIFHFHFHDNDLKNDLHLPPGEGKIPWQSIATLLKGTGYNKTVTFETFVDDSRILKSLKFVKSLFT